MGQEETQKFVARYRFPEIKRYKDGWRVVFWYQKNGTLQRHFYRCDKYRKNFRKSIDAEAWISEHICSPINEALQIGWKPGQPFPTSCKDDEKELRLSELADLFLENAYERYKANLINYTTYASYKTFCNIFNNPSSGVEDRKIKELTKVTAEKIVVKIKALREWSTKTTNNFIRLCKMLFKFAVDNSMISFNPFGKIAPIKGEEKSKRTLTKEEQGAIYKYLHKENLPFLVFTQLVYTDLIRPVEIFRIQCKDVDVENRKITLSASKTKNKKERVVLIPQSLNPLFARYLQEIDFEKSPKEAYLFSEDFRPKVTKEPLPSVYASVYWRKMCQELELPIDCKLYGLRHTGICDLLSILPVNTVRMIADHSDTKQTLHYANHETDQIRREVAAKAPIYGIPFC